MSRRELQQQLLRELAGFEVLGPFEDNLHRLACLVGGLLAGVTGAALAGQAPPPVLWLAAAVAGMIGGLLWALVPAILRVRWGLNEIITTLMMNYVAVNVCAWLKAYPSNCSTSSATAIINRPVRKPRHSRTKGASLGNSRLSLKKAPFNGAKGPRAGGLRSSSGRRTGRWRRCAAGEGRSAHTPPCLEAWGGWVGGGGWVAQGCGGFSRSRKPPPAPVAKPGTSCAAAQNHFKHEA